ncbi:MAG: hypothetical protein WBK91_09900 [Alphaproteobacteria bacterium]
MSRYRRQSGIAIGPILFVIALLGVLAAFFSSDSGNMGGAAREDTITATLAAQANLIRSKFNECNMIRDSWPVGDGTGTAVSAVTCPGDPAGQDNLWTGARMNQLAPPPQRFNNWTYYDYSGTGGGRCVKISPISASDPATKAGIRRAFAKFTSLEADYDSNGVAQSLVIWITRPSGAAGANCVAG